MRSIDITRLTIVLFLALVLGCGVPGDDTDGSVACGGDEECSDGVFCNGDERCDPLVGCVASPTPRCLAGQACDEAARRCNTDCAVADADGDGHDSIDCGGDDCDDADPERFPGNVEVCDATHDEDCDPGTFGARDADGDGAIDAACCNATAEGALVCGDDCDDSSLARRPGQLEICDGRDNDCDDAVDEEMHEVDWYPDEDGDGFGAAGSVPTRSCSPVAGASLRASDCDDADASRSPVGVERCDGEDDDCDGDVDEGACGGCAVDAIGCSGHGVCAVGACACDVGFDGDRCERCAEGFQGYPACAPECPIAGARLCEGTCVDVRSDASRCGGCDTVCPSGAHGTPACRDGACGLLCASPWGDCDGDSANGCESNLHEDVAGCGACGVRCTPPADAISYCNFGLCAWRCITGRGDCDGDGGNGCETSTETSVDHCSACGAPCVLPSAVAGCAGGACIVVACAMSFGDCDAIAANGCERDLRSDRDHCGVCGRACAATEGCIDAVCEPACTAPRAMCGSACVDTSADASHCGACDRACPAGDTCAAGICDSERVVEVSGGWYHTCARRASGALACWGNNGLGQLGDGTGTSSLTPVAVSSILDATQVACDAAITACAVRVGGSLACWGDNTYGKVGDGSTTLRESPVAVSGAAGIAQAAVGGLHTCARATSGQVYCWGDDSLGQLGDGTVSAAPTLTPVAVPGVGDATDLAVGDGFTCVVRASGAVWCWGTNRYGQLGDGTTSASPRPTPAAVSGISDAVQVAAGGYHACARRSTGAVVCWGLNDAGQLGVDTGGAGLSAVPVAVGLAPASAQIACGLGHSCARTTAGEVHCWGANSYGQLGDGTTVNRMMPVRAPVTSSAIDVGLGFEHTCAALSTGAVECWGNNANGRLGDGTTTSRPLPAQVVGL